MRRNALLHGIRNGKTKPLVFNWWFSFLKKDIIIMHTIAKIYKKTVPN